MILFIKVCFWMFILNVVVKVLCLGFIEYPREIKKWHDAVDSLILIPFVIWAWYLIYG